MQVLGHFKLLVILSAGIFCFHEDTNATRLLGMALAFGGIVMYTTMKQNTASGWEKISGNGKASNLNLKEGREDEIIPLKSIERQDEEAGCMELRIK